jgi:hypothetical protein
MDLAQCTLVAKELELEQDYERLADLRTDS